MSALRDALEEWVAENSHHHGGYADAVEAVSQLLAATEGTDR